MSEINLLDLLQRVVEQQNQQHNITILRVAEHCTTEDGRYGTCQIVVDETTDGIYNAIENMQSACQIVFGRRLVIKVFTKKEVIEAPENPGSDIVLYTRLLNRLGPDAPETLEFLKANKRDKVFVARAKVLNKLFSLKGKVIERTD